MRSTRNRRAQLDRLESRRLLSAVFPSNAEQYLVQLINRARANPSAEASRDGIDLNEGLAAGTISTAAKQPLAINPYLTDATEKHSQWMLDHDTFSHYEDDPTDAIGPFQRDQSAGYAFTGAYSEGENIAIRESYPTAPPLVATTSQMNDDLFIDSGEDGRGHRVNMENPNYKEVGTGVRSGVFPDQGTNWQAIDATEDFATSNATANGNSFLTGVSYIDNVTADSFYTPGEGIGGVTVTATNTSTNAVFSTTTWSAGGYTLALPNGTYNVVSSGGNFSPITYSNVVINGQNVEKDFVPTSLGGSAPTVSAALFLYSANPPQLSVTFSTNVGASLDSSDVVLTKAAGGSAGFSATFASYNAATNTALFNLPTTMADGSYTATLQATGITTASGTAMAANYPFNFFTLAGDANHDGTVNIADLGILASNYGKSGTFQVGDFDYDGVVNIADLGILATNYGKSLPTFSLARQPSTKAQSVASISPQTTAHKKLTESSFLADLLA